MTKLHMAYPYLLTLQISDTANYFSCDLCGRFSCGFKYKSRERGEYLTLDVRCAEIYEPFDNQCHMHPLFLTTVEISQTCSICRREWPRNLNYLECDFVSCFCCATLPYKVSMTSISRPFL